MAGRTHRKHIVPNSWPTVSIQLPRKWPSCTRGGTRRPDLGAGAYPERRAPALLASPPCPHPHRLPSPLPTPSPLTLTFTLTLTLTAHPHPHPHRSPLTAHSSPLTAHRSPPPLTLTLTLTHAVRVVVAHENRVRVGITAVWPGEGRVGVHGVMAVVERLHPMVVQLEVPTVARRWTRCDDQHLTWPDTPVGVVVPDVWVAPGLVGRLLVKERELVGV